MTCIQKCETVPVVIQYETELIIHNTNQDGMVSCSLYCKSTQKPFDNVAEFIVDSSSRENIAIVNDVCINKEQKQCVAHYCGCNPFLNEYRLNLTMSALNAGQVFGCQLRFLTEDTRDIIKILTTRRFDGTAFSPSEYDIKIIEMEKKNENKAKDGNTHPLPGDAWRIISSKPISVAIGYVALFVVFVIYKKWLVYRCRKKDMNNESGNETKSFRSSIAYKTPSREMLVKKEDTDKIKTSKI